MLPGSFMVKCAGSCMTAARIIAGTLLDEGASDVVVVEGWIQFREEDGSEPDDLRFEHTWVEWQAEILDPTLAQFETYLDYYEYRREELERTPSATYLADDRLNTATPEIFFRDGYIPLEVRQFLPERD